MAQELTQEVVRDLLDYNPETGTLNWKERSRVWFDRDRVWKTWNKRYANSAAAYLYTNKNGYQRKDIKVLGIKYPAHRVIWLWMTGKWPSSCVDHIDHIDHDATNNRWSNLREADSGENGRNRSRRKTNKSGVTGVCWNRYYNKWQAQVWANGKNNQLGYFDRDDLDIAAMTVMEFRADNGFSPTHGLEDAPYHKDKEN